MQLHIKFFIVCCFVFLFGLIPTAVHANGPVIKGRIQIKDTHAPISGVWIKWQDGYQAVWYTKTDDNGDFTYPSWGALTQAQRDLEAQTMIDPTLSGVKNTPKSSTYSAAEYGCWQNYHGYYFVTPTGWGVVPGELIPIKLQVGFANGATELILPTLDVGKAIPSPSPTPTPTINAVCACDGVSVEGVREAGNQITVSGKAMVTSANSATSKVNSMTYTVKKNGQTISTSSPIPAGQPTTDGTKDSYQSTFAYTIPPAQTGEIGSTVRYAVDVSTQCGSKSVPTVTPSAQANTAQGLGGFIRSLFGLSTPTSVPTSTVVSYSQIQDVQAPDNSRSLQFGTFAIATPTPTPYLNPQCSSVEFDVKY